MPPVVEEARCNNKDHYEGSVTMYKKKHRLALCLRRTICLIHRCLKTLKKWTLHLMKKTDRKKMR